jgi:hypothetical protein
VFFDSLVLCDVGEFRTFVIPAEAGMTSNPNI